MYSGTICMQNAWNCFVNSSEHVSIAFRKKDENSSFDQNWNFNFLASVRTVQCACFCKTYLFMAIPYLSVSFSLTASVIKLLFRFESATSRMYVLRWCSMPPNNGPMTSTTTKRLIDWTHTHNINWCDGGEPWLGQQWQQLLQSFGKFFWQIDNLTCSLCWSTESNEIKYFILAQTEPQCAIAAALQYPKLNLIVSIFLSVCLPFTLFSPVNSFLFWCTRRCSLHFARGNCTNCTFYCNFEIRHQNEHQKSRSHTKTHRIQLRARLCEFIFFSLHTYVCEKKRQKEFLFLWFSLLHFRSK